MKRFKRFILWSGTIICGFMTLATIMTFSFDILTIGMLLGFTYWLVLFINKLCYKRNKFFEWINKKNWLFLFGFLIIFTASGLVVETNTASLDNTQSIVNEQQTEIDNHQHNYNKTITKIEPTCKEQGQEVLKCECGKEKINKTNKIQCIFKLIQDKKPDFVSNGEKQYQCKWCNKIKLERYGKIKAPISFTMTGYEIDFLGGVTHYIKITNNTDKPIKYIHYSLYYTNAVGDIIYSSLQIGTSPLTWTITGPIASKNSINFSGYGFYNNNVKGYILTKIEIEYMDGTTQSIFSSDFENYEQIIF